MLLLLKKQHHLSCTGFHILDLVHHVPMVAFNTFLCPCISSCVRRIGSTCTEWLARIGIPDYLNAGAVLYSKGSSTLNTQSNNLGASMARPPSWWGKHPGSIFKISPRNSNREPKLKNSAAGLGSSMFPCSIQGEKWAQFIAVAIKNTNLSSRLQACCLNICSPKIVARRTREVSLVKLSSISAFLEITFSRGCQWWESSSDITLNLRIGNFAFLQSVLKWVGALICLCIELFNGWATQYK